jgi:4-deoxy-L-threo-5-hexosulose-uronate ketol-isomerase
MHAIHYLPTPDHAKRMTSEELRAHFLVRGLFTPGSVALRHIDLDRVVLGGAVPTGEPLTLGAPASLGAEFFLERRELGVLNIGGAGSVTVDGKRWALRSRDVLYVGMGSRDVSFASDDAAKPAKFYLVSYPSHVTHAPMVVTAEQAQGGEAGSADRANKRRIARYIHAAGAPSGQLVMGVTKLETGSVWNTMPAHTHHRRTEVYLYFDLPADAVVFHLMGEPNETRDIVVRDGDVVLSPGWSIHAGCGTASYSFCWAMGGENKDYADMLPVDLAVLR